MTDRDRRLERRMSDASHIIQWNREGDVTVARFRARSVTEEQLLEQAFQDMKSLAEAGGSKVLFSLGNVDAISSRALAALVWLNRELRARNGQLKVCDVEPMVLHVFALTRLDRVLDLCASKEDGLAAFREGS